MTARDMLDKRRLRGMVLRLVCANHEAQRERLDEVTLTSLLRKLEFEVYVSELREVLQDLRDRGLLKFKQEKSRFTGDAPIRWIEILPAGRDIYERTRTDPAVDVE